MNKNNTAVKPMKVRKGDTVEIIAGKDKGKRGKIIHAMPKQTRVMIEGCNMVIRHQKSTNQNRAMPESQTGRISKPAPLHVSNVMLVCPHCSKATRVEMGLVGEKRVRRCKKCNEFIGSV